MNGFVKLRGLLHHLALVGMIGATTSTASAWTIIYCDGYIENNTMSRSGAGCETPKSVDCWEDPSHNPPQWASGKTYARAQVRTCNGTTQIRAYAFDNLKKKATELNGTGYFARATMLMSNGDHAFEFIDDFSANGQYGNWLTITNAYLTVESLGYITGP